MHHDEARTKIRSILGSIRFEGHFNKCFDNLKDTQQEHLLAWIHDCRNLKADPIQSKYDRELIGFVERFGSSLRAILTKRKQGFFLTLFLDKHKYYENRMTKLGF